MAYLTVYDYDNAFIIYKNQPSVMSQTQFLFPAWSLEEKLTNCGAIAVLKNDLREAESNFLEALKRLPKKSNIGSAIVQFNLSYLYEKLQDDDKAREYRTIVRKNFPQFPFIGNHLSTKESSSMENDRVSHKF